MYLPEVVQQENFPALCISFGDYTKQKLLARGLTTSRKQLHYVGILNSYTNQRT